MSCYELLVEMQWFRCSKSFRKTCAYITVSRKCLECVWGPPETVWSLLSLCLQKITVIRVAQLTSRPFVPPSVSLQTNLWKYKSCEKETSSPRICPSLPPSVSLHPITPSFSQSIHQQQWCAVIIVRASLRSSVCLHARPRRVVICLPLCLHTCMYFDVCMYWMCVETAHC